MGVCNCSMFCCTLLYVHFSIAIILMGKRELIALLNLSSWCLMMVERLFLTVPRGCLQFVIVVFPDHTHLLFFMIIGHVSDFLPECKSKRSFGLFIHHAGTFGVKVLSMFLKFMFADSRTGKVLTPKDLMIFGFFFI